MASPLSRRNVIHSAYVADSRSMSGDSAGALAVEISILPAASVRDVSAIGSTRIIAWSVSKWQ
jgi:hypothetical protein